MKPTFLKREKTLITPLLTCQTEEELLIEIEAALKQGADAFGFMIERLPKELRTEEKMRSFFVAMQGLTIYVTCYMRGDMVEETDEERAEYLLQALRCGATLADVRGDMFAPCEGELTDDPVAIEKQMRLIEKIHEIGKEALISSHVQAGEVFRFMEKDEVLQMALEHQRRGADIAKIVTKADTDEELLKNFETFFYVKEKLSAELLFLCNGKKCLAHRLAGPLIGEPMVFAKERKYATVPKGPQQAIEVFKSIAEKL